MRQVRLEAAELVPRSSIEHVIISSNHSVGALRQDGRSDTEQDVVFNLGEGGCDELYSIFSGCARCVRCGDIAVAQLVMHAPPEEHSAASDIGNGNILDPAIVAKWHTHGKVISVSVDVHIFNAS